MALSQERMITVLSTTRRFYNDFLALKSATRNILSALPINPTTEDCLNVLQSIQLTLDQIRPAESDIALLIAEEQHYRSTFRRNQRAAEYARRRRARKSLSPDLLDNGREIAPVRHLARKPLDQTLPVQKSAPAPLVPLDQLFAQYNYSEPASDPIDPDADLF